MMKLQIIYQAECFEPSTSDFHNGWLSEMDAMRNLGIPVSDTPNPDAERLLYRSYVISEKSAFPTDPRYISRWEDYRSTGDMSLYLPLIQDLTIPSFIAPMLDEQVIMEIKRRGWERCFVRSCTKSLKYMFPESGTEEELPIWPEVSMEKLSMAYHEYRDTMKPPYIIRKYISECEIQLEERYWIMNNHACHRSGIIPEIVVEAVKRLAVLNSPYYVIDASPQYIVEVNPGVSSDPYPENIPLFFPEWIKREFAS